ESEGAVRLRSGRFYPRHFSLALAGTTHPIEVRVDGVARGSIQIRAAVAASVAPSRENLSGLVRVGGWRNDAVAKASRELETVIQSMVRQFTERYLLDELSSEALSQHLAAGVKDVARGFGLELVSLTVQSIDPADPEIADAMRRRESARILEQTESLNQKARMSAARARLEADAQIALSEHDLELKRLDLKREEIEKEALLARKRTEDELERSRMRLAYEQEEMALLKSSPELLLLSPQAARLAEASQSLKNARTIVSLWPSDAERESGLSGLFQRFLELVLEADKKKRLESSGAKDES
ncbi:MAG TPA: SPFH domain-containing protein, partial [Bryobacteraceae bacterium]|nr:SPFH domain-containing protein [Bryobacteraceae bacterium]